MKEELGALKEKELFMKNILEPLEYLASLAEARMAFRIKNRMPYAEGHAGEVHRQCYMQHI